jgi:alpha-ketoglutarate-dependent taurine dioxygenase
MRITPISDPFGTTIEGSPRERLADVDPNIVRDLIKSRGVVMFSGFRAPLADFDQFIRQFGDKFMKQQGGGAIRQKVSEDSTLLSTRYDYGREGGKQDTFGLALHGEMYYSDNRPVILWFYCETPAAADGETTVCDGVQIYDALSDEFKELLAEKKLKYIRRYLDGHWQLVYQTDDINEAVKFCAVNGITARVEDGNALVTEYVHPGIITSRWGGHTVYINSALLVVWQEYELGRDTSVVRLEDGSKLPKKLIDEVVAAQKRLMFPMVWQSGDFAVLDNTRAMHGRRPFKDTERQIYLRMVREVAF